MGNIKEARIKFYGLLSTNPDIDPKQVAKELKTPVPTLMRWKKDYEADSTLESLDKLIEADEVIVERAANIVVEELAKELEPMIPKHAPAIEGEVLSKEQLQEIEEEKQEQEKRLEIYKEQKAKEITKGIKGLGLLKEDIQEVAQDLIVRVKEEMEENDYIPIKDVKDLTAVVTQLQNTFFNRPTTNIQVNNTNQNITEGALHEFRTNLRN